jgi:hypothetical protein
MHEGAASKVPLSPILCSIPQASAMIGRGIGAIYTLIGDKKIRAVKSSGRTLVDVASLRRYVDELPDAIIRPRHRAPKRVRDGAR